MRGAPSHSGAVRKGAHSTRGRSKCRQEVFFISFCLNFCPDTHIFLHVLDTISFDGGELMTPTRQVWSFTFTQLRLAAAVKFTALKLDHSWNTHTHSHTRSAGFEVDCCFTG